MESSEKALVRGVLEGKLSRLLNDICALRTQLQETSPDRKRRHQGAVMDDSVVADREASAIAERLNLLADEMGEVSASLGRLDSGNYGICVGCAQKIPPKRLEAVPYALRCVGCQERFERFGV